jgi:hypothetical protein
MAAICFSQLDRTAPSQAPLARLSFWPAALSLGAPRRDRPMRLSSVVTATIGSSTPLQNGRQPAHQKCVAPGPTAGGASTNSRS